MLVGKHQGEGGFVGIAAACRASIGAGICAACVTECARKPSGPLLWHSHADRRACVLRSRVLVDEHAVRALTCTRVMGGRLHAQVNRQPPACPMWGTN